LIKEPYKSTIEDMEQSRFRRRLAVWVGAGALLAGGTVAVGLYVGGSAAWGLGAILATVYSGTLIFIEHERIKDGQKKDDDKVQINQMEPDMNEHMRGAFNNNPDVTRRPTPDPLIAWQTPRQESTVGWHPALNGIEDVLVAQITESSTIMAIIERVGMNPGIMPRGQGSAATLWHGALRHAWTAGREKKVCEILREANKMGPSRDLQELIDKYCVKQ
jgi:hypothetical protein